MDDLNEDWIKTLSWDLGSWNAFLDYLGVYRAPADVQRRAVAQFTKLPAWRAVPDDIRRQAADLGVTI